MPNKLKIFKDLFLPDENSDSDINKKSRTNRRKQGNIARNPALDGLRGIFVILVALYDTGLVGFSGFFIWVDAFFVFSGYLITGKLIKEINTSGRIKLVKFWIPRVRRVLPALITVIFVYAVAETIFGAGSIISSVRGDCIAALLGVVNWYLIFTRFGLEAHAQHFGLVNGQAVLKGVTFYKVSDGNNGLLNIWILSILEQFYLLWPLIVVGMYKWLKTYRLLFRMTLFLAVLSAARMFAAYNHGANINGGYYSTDSRSEALMIGAALAFLMAMYGEVKEWVRSTLDSVVPYVFIVSLIMTAYATRFSNWVFAGGFLVFDVFVAVLIAFVVLCPNSELMSIVKNRVFLLLGNLSLGLFLWQYPIRVALTYHDTGLNTVPLYILQEVVTFILACISLVFIERPFITGVYFRRIKKSVVVSFAGVITVLVVIFVVTTLATSYSTLKSSNNDLFALTARDPIRVLVIGDSMAYSLSVGLQHDESLYGTTVDNVGLPNCSNVGINSVNLSRSQPNISNQCSDWNTIFKNAIINFSPDVVIVVVGGASVFQPNWNTGWNRLGNAAYDVSLSNSLTGLGDIFQTAGLPVIYCTVPYFGGSLSQVATQSKVNSFNSIIRTIVQNNSHWFYLFDLNKTVDPNQKFSSVIQGTSVRSSNGASFAEPQGGQYVAPYLFSLAVQIGLNYRLTPSIPRIVINK